MSHILLLAGSGEARALAARLPRETDHRLTLSFADAPRVARDLDVPIRTGGFGGAEGFIDYLRDQRVDAVINATHPFAARITRRTARICADLGIPHLRLLRPGWTAGPGDRWQFVADPQAAAALIRPGQVVFVASGRETLPALEHSGARITCRQIDMPDAPFPFPGGEYLEGTPPFSAEEEVALFKRLGVEVLLVKNAGGAASRSKLDAARALGIKVLLLERPADTACRTVEDVDAAVAWARSL